MEPTSRSRTSRSRTSRSRDPAPRPAPNRRLLLALYARLRRRFGHRGWWPGETPLEIALGAVLTQNTAWTNVAAALANLRGAGLLDWRRLAALFGLDHAAVRTGRERPVQNGRWPNERRRLGAGEADGHQGSSLERFAALIRPSGYYRLKTRRVASLLAYLAAAGCGGDLPALCAHADWRQRRVELLGVWGLGPESADSILLYACGQPTFVVDAYTRRIFGRLGLVPEAIGYEELRALFMSRLGGHDRPALLDLFQDYHAQLVELGKQHCRPTPRCAGCPLRASCALGRRAT